jgi:hypothetical protein
MTWIGVVLALVGRVVFSFVDPAITESSGLVDLGDAMMTMNDSGGAPVLYTVDGRTGRTIGRTTYADRVEDVEALAPGRGPSAGRIWVGDIGDNDQRRTSIRVYRVLAGLGDSRVTAPSYDLVYPDGAHDAESLVVDGRGRLFVISKGLLGGTVYAAPATLRDDRPNRLRPVAEVGIWATDAALFPDGRHVLVRGYDTAAIFTFPGFRPVASLDLPHQRQGEGVSIGSSGRIRLSSEGRSSPVLEITLPDPVAAALAGTPRPTATASPSVTPSPRGAEPTTAGDASAHGGGPTWLLALAVAAGAVGVVLVLALLVPPWVRRSRRARHRPRSDRAS